MTHREIGVRWLLAGVAGAALVATIPCGSVTAGGRTKADPVVELGRRLFFDPAVSRSGDNSCATCHDAEHGFASRRRTDLDDFTMTRRHSQTLLDAANGKRFHWDGEFDSVADLVEARLGTPAGARARHGPNSGDPTGGTTPPPVGPVPPGNTPPPTSGGGEAPPPADDPPGDDDPETVPIVDEPPETPITQYGASNPCAPYDKPGGAVPSGMRTPHEATKAKEKGETSSKSKGATYKAPGDGDDPDSGASSSSDPAPSDSTSGTEGSTSAPAPAETGGTSQPAYPQSSPSPSGGGSTPTPDGSGSTPTSPGTGGSSGGGWQGGGTPPPSTGTPAPSGSGTAPTGGDGTPGTTPDSKTGPTSSTKSEDHAQSVAARVEKDGRYDEAFEAAFGSRQVTTARIAKAIGTFVESIRSTESPFDRYVGGDKQALSDSARRGLALFQGAANCSQCHLTTSARGGRAPFTDQEFHDTGISARSAARRAVTPVPVVALPYDDGRAVMTKAHADLGSFKTPTLRDVALRAPFMHDGSMRSLTDVVRHYARGGFRDDHLDPRIHRFDAKSGEVQDLVAFLESLTGDVRPAIAPDEPNRAALTKLRFVDATGKPVAGLPVRLDPAGDSLPGDIPLLSHSVSLQTDEQGRLAYAPGRRTHMRLSVPRGMGAPKQGAWIPDTCRELTIALPVTGKATLLVALPLGSPVAKGLVANTELTPLTDLGRSMLSKYAPDTLAALRRKVATFTLEGVVDLDGRTYARYATWIPAGAPESAFVEVPLASRTTSHAVSLVAGKESKIDIPR